MSESDSILSVTQLDSSGELVLTGSKIQFVQGDVEHTLNLDNVTSISFSSISLHPVFKLGVLSILLLGMVAINFVGVVISVPVVLMIPLGGLSIVGFVVAYWHQEYSYAEQIEIQTSTSTYTVLVSSDDAVAVQKSLESTPSVDDSILSV